MLAPVLFFVIAASKQTAPGLDRKVSFSCPATQAGQVVDSLSKQTGETLAIDPRLADEMWIVRVKDVPLRILLDKLAYAATGHWEPNGAGLKLDRPDSLRRTVEHEERVARIAAIKKAIDGRVKDLVPFAPSIIRNYFETERNRQRNGGDESSPNRQQSAKDAVEFAKQQPGDRLTTRILQSMDPGLLADLQSGQRTVFSTSPTAMQKSLDADAIQAMEQFVREQTQWTAASQIGEQEANGPYQYMGWTENAAVTGTPTRLLMVCTADWSSQSIDIQFKLCDNRGNIVSQPQTSGFSLNGQSWLEYGDLEAMPDPTPAQPETKPGKPIELSPLAAEMRRLLQVDGPGRNAAVPPASPELRRFILDSQNRDPLTLFPSEPVLRAAEETSTNVAACVDDASFQSGASLDGSAADVLSQFGAVKDGWLTARPNDPLHPVVESRKGLAAFLASIDKLGRLTLDAEAAYAQTAPGFDGLGWQLDQVLLPQMQAMMPVQSQDWQFLKLFGALSSSDRDVLLKGSKLTLVNMTGDQQAAIDDLVYSREAELGGQNGDMIVDRFGPGPPAYGTLVTEPTELLPGGLDMRITLQMTSQDQDAVFSSMQVGDQVIGLMPTDPDQIAMALASTTNKDIVPTDFSETILGYQTGRRQDYNLTVNLPSLCRDSGTLSDFQIASGPMITFEKLPDAVKKQIQDKVDEMAKFFKDLRANGGSLGGSNRGGGSTVPPP